MSTETILLAVGMLPGPLDIWSERTRARPERPRQPMHPRPRRRQPAPAKGASAHLDAPDHVLEIIHAAMDEDACHEAMIWEAGRIHGPKGLDAADLVLDCAAEFLEDGTPPSWWCPDWQPDDIWEARRAIDAADKAANADRERYTREQRAIQAEPCSDAAWRHYDEAAAAYPARLAAYVEGVRSRARRVTGYASREEHARALYGFGERDVSDALAKVGGGR